MKKSRIAMAGVALIALLFVVSCPQPPEPEPVVTVVKSDKALLTGITFASIPNVGEIPAPLDWSSGSFSADSPTGSVVVNNLSLLTGAHVTATVSAGATVKYAKATSASTKPTNFLDLGQITVAQNNYLYFKVTAEDEKVINYYRFCITYVPILSSEAGLNSLTIGGKSATLGTPAATWNGANIVAGAVGFTSVGSFTVTPLAKDSLAAIKYAKAAGTATPTFSTTNVVVFTASELTGSFIYVEVTAQDGTTKLVYKIAVTITLSSNANLTAITIGGVSASFGTPNASWNVAAAGAASFDNASQLNSAQVLAVKADANAAMRFAYVAPPGTDTPTFASTSVFDMASGGVVYIEVTAENGTSKLVYKVEVIVTVPLSDDATLDPYFEHVQNAGDNSFTDYYDCVILNGQKATTMSDGAASISGVATVGFVDTLIKFSEFPLLGISLEIKANHANATVEYAQGPEDATPESLSFVPYHSGAMETFTNSRNYLYVRVTAENRITRLYYVFKVSYNKEAYIYYGSPSIADNTIDPLWDNPDLMEYEIDGVAEGTAGTNDTYGVAKCLWDDDGLYVFVRVVDPTGPFGGTANPSSNQHLYDSVEIFINERVDADGNVFKGNGTGGGSANADNSAYAGRGGQYRISSAGWKSGDPTSAQTKFRTNANYPKSAWNVTHQGTGNPNFDDKDGYILIFKCPWRFSADNTGADPDVTPAAPWPAENGKKIGLDLQINACTAVGTRTHVLVWNNRTGSNYRNCFNWGEATLTGKP